MGFFSDVFKGSGGSIVSGALGAVTGMIGNNSRNDQAWQLAHMNADLQREFAQNSIKWRVEDAKRAGVHPLAALGISPASFSPVSASFGDLSGVSSALADMGQNIDRAILAGKDSAAQEEALSLQNRMSEATVRGAELDNQLKEMQLASKLADTIAGASMPIAAPPVDPRAVTDAGGGLAGSLVNPTPMQVTPTKQVGVEPSALPSTGHLVDGSGKVTKVQSADAKNRLEEDLVGSFIWLLNNRIVPHLKTMFDQPPGIHEPPRDMLPPGAVRWAYDGYGSWIPVDSHGNDMTKDKEGIINRINRRFANWR